MRVLVGMSAGVFSILAWGDVACGLLEGRFRARGAAWRMSVSWILGSGVVSFVTFLLLWAGAPLTPAVLAFGTTGVVLWLFLRRGRCLPRVVAPELGGWALLFVAVIAVETILVGFTALVAPLTAWDSWVNWASKARVLFIDQELSAAVHNDSSRLPTNPGYPLLLPLAETWLFVWTGSPDERAVGAISILYVLSLVLLFWSAARRVLPPTGALAVTALLASVPRVTRAAPTGLADLPLAAFVLASFLLAAETLAGEEQRAPLPLLGLLAGLLPWMKDEGWLWLALLGGVLAAGLLVKVRRGEARSSGALLALGAFLAMAVPVSAAWQLFLASRGTIRYVFLPVTLETLARNGHRLPEIAGRLTRASLDPAWNFVWPLVGLALLAGGRKALSRPYGWLSVPVVLFVALAGLSYVFSGFEPYEPHLRNSVDRLLLQALPLALLWLAAQGAEGPRERSRTL